MKTNYIKAQFYTHLMKNGAKFLSEKIFLKSIKKLQKMYHKNHSKVLRFVVVFLAPLAKLKRIKNKKNKILKEFPFILSAKSRLTISIKEILKRKKGMPFHKKFAKELFSVSENTIQSVKLKKISQENIVLKKKYSFYRWFY